MTEPPDDGLMVRLAVGDARTAQEAGAKFARDLAGGHGDDFTLALMEQSSCRVAVKPRPVRDP